MRLIHYVNTTRGLPTAYNQSAMCIEELLVPNQQPEEMVQLAESSRGRPLLVGPALDEKVSCMPCKTAAALSTKKG